MHGMVIRPALVEVARAPAALAEEPATEATQPEEPSEEAAQTTDETTGEEIAEEAETENVGP